MDDRHISNVHTIGYAVEFPEKTTRPFFFFGPIGFLVAKGRILKSSRSDGI